MKRRSLSPLFTLLTDFQNLLKTFKTKIYHQNFSRIQKELPLRAARYYNNSYLFTQAPRASKDPGISPCVHHWATQMILS